MTMFSNRTPWRAMWLAVITAGLQAAALADETVDMTRAAAPFPPIGEYQVLRGDFHMHTPHSDGKVTAPERVIEAKRYGYDVIAITDHGKLPAYEEALDTAQKLDVVLLRGMETGLRDKEHLVSLNFDDQFVPRDSHRWSDTPEGETVYYQKQWQHLGDSGAFVLYAHPHVGLREPVQWGIEQGLLQGIEVKNGVVGTGWNTVESHSTHWYPFALDWAVEHNLAVFANSDVHGARAGNQPITLILARERTVPGVVDAMKARRTVAWFDGMLCAPKETLSTLMAGLVSVRFVDGDAGSRALIENRGPVHIQGIIDGDDSRTIDLRPYDRVCITLDGAKDTLSVTWRNLWSRSTENLTSVYVR